MNASTSDTTALLVLQAEHALERLAVWMDNLALSAPARGLMNDWLADIHFGLLAQRRAAGLAEQREAA